MRLGDPIAPLAASLANDIRFVQAMEEVKTDIGFARAWVRLSLEKKCLSKHLKTLLSNQELLRQVQRRMKYVPVHLTRARTNTDAFIIYSTNKEHFMLPVIQFRNCIMHMLR